MRLLLPFFLLLLLLLAPPALAQLSPCGLAPCQGWVPGADIAGWDAPPDPSWVDPNAPDANAGFSLSNWINCSAVFGPDWKFANASAYSTSKIFTEASSVPSDFRGYAYNNIDDSNINWLGWKAKYPEQWNASHPGYRGANGTRCTRITQMAMCMSNVAMHDISGRANRYAYRPATGKGPTACFSVCEEYWDACGLRDAPPMVGERPTFLLGCRTPSTLTNARMKYNNTYLWGSGKYGCWNTDGTVDLPNCSAFMGFQCKNGGEWAPDCMGCLCRPGFGGSDCGRCSSKREMWPHRYREATDYAGKYDGRTYASAACAILRGADPHAGPIGNGTMVDALDFPCSELDVMMPLKIEEIGLPVGPTHSAGGGGSTGGGGNGTHHRNHTSIPINHSQIVEQVYDCAFESDNPLYALVQGGSIRLRYDIRAKPACFDDPSASNNRDPWQADDCDVGGNISFDIINQAFQGDASIWHGSWIDAYSPRIIGCNMSECVVSPYDECEEHTRLGGFFSPCIKCNYIKCACPPHSFLAGTSTGCFIKLFAPTLLDGATTPSYLACKSSNSSAGECIFANAAFPGKFPMKKCMGATCYDARIPTQAKQPMLYLLFYAGLVLSVGTLVFSGVNALSFRGDEEVGAPLAAAKSPAAAPHNQRHHLLSAMHVGYKIGGKSILRGADMRVSTASDQGGVMAIIGPSGAGKTTFLDVLAGLKDDEVHRERDGAVGIVSLDGKALSSVARRKLFGYVMQDETLVPTLTVRESLRFAADLRRRPAARLCASPFCCLSNISRRCCTCCRFGNTYSKNETLVEELLQLLDLKHVADQKVGSVSLRGISGGERKRVAIGMEIICDPQVLLLDEPTTGLDAASAMKVMQVLNTIVRNHRRIVIATIHQPRSDIFRALGGVTVVVPGGRIVYSGNADGAAPYFQGAVQGLFSGATLGGDPTTTPLVGRPLQYIEAKDNPADFIIDQMDVLDDNTRGALAMQWKKKSRLQQQKEEEQSNSSSLGSNSSSLDGADLENMDASAKLAPPMNSCGQCCLLFGRANRQLFRSPSLLMLQYGTPAFCGLAFGFIYEGITDDLSGVQNLAGSFFAMQVFWCLVSMTALDTWNGERVIVRREVAQGNYGITAYFVAQLCKEMLLLRVLPPIIFALPFTMLSGKCSEVDSFAKFSLILILTSTSFSALMLLVGACFKNTRSANAVGVLLMVFSLLFGGLLVNKATAVLDPESTWYLPLFYAAPLSYAYEAMMIQVLLGASINFNPKGFKTRVRTDGQVWLANFGMNGDNAARDLAALVVFTVGATLLVLPALAWSHGLICRCRMCSVCEYKPKRRRARGDSNIQMSVSARLALNRRDGRHSPLLPSGITGSSSGVGGDDGGGGGGGGGGSSNTGAGGEAKSSSSSSATHTPYVACEPDDLLAHSLRFDGVYASVNKGTCCAGDNIRQILRGVSGEASANSGGVFAIMGPSGAGKTTLLDVIAGRKTEGTFGGQISVNGVAYTSVSRRKQVFGYVMQEETLVPCLTVMESLLFSAQLRMDSAAADAITDVVHRVIDDLGLSKVAHSRIGAVGGTTGGAYGNASAADDGDGSVKYAADMLSLGDGGGDSSGGGGAAAGATSGSRGISGGERKRVAIGMELVVNPPVLLLDEPTTGLDAAAAASVMHVLSDLVRRRGTVVICTIHQPRAQVFQGLGRAMVLRPLRAGTEASLNSVVFDGPPSSAESFFAAQGHVCSGGMNIADMILDLVAAEASAVSRGDVESRLLESKQVSMTTSMSLPSSEYSAQSFGRGEAAESQTKSSKQSRSNVCRCQCMWQFSLLVRLEARRLVRSPGSMIVHAGVAVAVGLLFGFVYRDMQPNLQGTWNRFLGLFSEVTFFGLLGLSAVGNWQPDRVRFLRERASGYYSTLPYYCSKFLVDALVHRVVPVLVFVACSYSLIGWSQRFDSAYVNSDAFLEASACINAGSSAAQREKAIENSGICKSDPLANSGDPGLDAAGGGGLGAFGRSPGAHILFLSLAAISSATLGSLVSAGTRSTKVANFLTVLTILLFVMFSGALVSNTGMPWYAGWISYLSPFAFIFEALSVGNFQDQCFVFNPTTMASMFGPGKTSSLACVEVPGYKWELNFGCTAAGRWNATDVDAVSGLAHCQFNYGTIERDLQAALALLGVYVGLSTVALAWMRERR